MRGGSVVPFEQALRQWREAVGPHAEAALVANPAYIASPCEIYPLAERNPGPFDAVVGFVMDMDGTTTTTEPLCLHSLEWMVRQITDRRDPRAWPGLDHAKDYPNVIGNSTTRHVEYLIRTYGSQIRPAAFRRAYAAAVFWTLARGRDEARRREVAANAVALGLRPMLDDPAFGEMVRRGLDPFWRDPAEAAPLLDRYAQAVAFAGFADQVRAAVDVYYVRYHTILAALHDGLDPGAVRLLELPADEKLIAPMPAVGVFLALVRGWLGHRASLFYESLADHVADKTGVRPRYGPEALAELGRAFEARPAKLAIVTSSIVYEADIVLGEVFRALREDAAEWPLPVPERERIVRGFADHRAFYDAYVTASDSSEIRLKPHRDLYSLALFRMGIRREDYARVVGFEDSESGVIAIRAAGIGCSVALPFAQSAGHDFTAAVHVLPGQLPEAILNHRCFLRA